MEDHRMGFMSFKEEKDDSSKKVDVSVSEVIEDMKTIDLGGVSKIIKDAPDEPVVAQKYTTKRKGNLRVGYAVIKDADYYYQIEFLNGSSADEKEFIGAIISTFSSVVPEQNNVFIHQPPKDIDWPVYTVIVKDIAKKANSAHFMVDILVDKILSLSEGL